MFAGSKVGTLFSYKYEQHPDFGTLSYGIIHAEVYHAAF